MNPAAEATGEQTGAREPEGVGRSGLIRTRRPLSRPESGLQIRQGLTRNSPSTTKMEA